MKRRQVCEWWYRIRWGFWCVHALTDGVGGVWSTWTPWHTVDGMRKHRWCTECGRAEWV